MEWYLSSTSPDKVESVEAKIAALNVKHKVHWVSLVQMDPNPSMVQYNKSFKKGFLDLLVLHQKRNSVRVTATYNNTLNIWARN